MKKILFALLGVLTLFVSCSKDSNLDDYNKHPEKALEIALAKLPDYHIYSGSTVLKSTLVPTETRAGFAASHRGLKEGTPSGDCPSKMPLNQVAKKDGRYVMQNTWEYTVYPGENIVAAFDVSGQYLIDDEGNVYDNPNQNHQLQHITIYVAPNATLSVLGNHNGNTHVIVKVFKGGKLYWDWNGQGNNILSVGNGGTAEIHCWGTLGTFNNGQPSNSISQVDVKAGSSLKLYEGDMEQLYVNGKFFLENEKDGKRAEVYSEIPVVINGDFEANSGVAHFVEKFECNNIDANSGTEVTFDKCSTVKNDATFRGGLTKIYVNDYLKVNNNLSFDSNQLYLSSSLLEVGGMTDIYAKDNTALIKSTSDNESIFKTGKLMFVSFEPTDPRITTLQGKMVVLSSNIVYGYWGWNGYTNAWVTNGSIPYNAQYQTGVRINPQSDTYYLPADGDNCRPSMGNDPTPEPIYYWLKTGVASGEGTTAGDQEKIKAGDWCEVSATPATGWKFVKWSDGSTDAIHKIQINQNVEIFATFEKIEYTLEVVVKDGQEGWGTVTGGGTFNYGDKPTYSATPADGYRFVKWEETNSTNASEQVFMDGNKKFTAVFEPVPTYDLTVVVASGCEDMGTTKGTETNIPEGTVKQFEAIPNDGYEFIGWTDGNTDPVRTVTMDQDYTFTAMFKAKEKDPDPTDPIFYEDKGHVEVNLSVNDKKDKDDYIWSKLSIHVRDTTDVEIFIPVGAEYYCEADDFYIVQKHDKEDAYVYTDNTTTVEMEIAGQKVTLTIAHEQNGMRITTDGINAAVLKECRKTYGDGITFEVYSYYNEKITSREMLKGMLDQTTIKFLDEEPDYYINAFGKVREYTDPIYGKYNETTHQWTLYTDEACTQILPYTYWKRNDDGTAYIFGHKNPWDCVVTPIDVQTGHFDPANCIEGEYNKNYPQVPETK